MDIIKIGIVEDDAGWQKMLSISLNTHDDFQVVWVTSSKETAVNWAMETKTKADVIIMDLCLSNSEKEGIDATFDICRNSNAKIIVLTSYADINTIRDAFTAGAVNYILKENHKDIPSAIRMTYRRKSPVEIILDEYKFLKKESVLINLTQSEREIFKFIENGKKIPEIIKLLNKTESTIKSQITSILKKLKSKTTKDALEKAYRKGVE